MQKLSQQNSGRTSFFCFVYTTRIITNMADEEYSMSEFEDEDDEEVDEYDNGSYDENEINYKENENSNKDTFDLNQTDAELHRELADQLLIEKNECDYDDIDIESPQVILAKLRKDDDTYMEFPFLKVNRIKCLALCKIIFGEKDWRTAEAHLQLAETYLKGKYHLQQTLKHANSARDILLSTQNREDTAVPSLEFQYILQNMYFILGKTNYKLGKFKASENCLLKAKLSVLGDSFGKLGNFGQSIEYIEEALEVVQKMPNNYRVLSVGLYKQMVCLELMNEKYANLETAFDSAERALNISIEVNGHDCKETAELLTLVSKVESLKEVSSYDKIEKNIKEAQDIYSSMEMTEKEIGTIQMYCKVLMQQEKLSPAKSALDEAILKSEELFGDCSIQSADLYELMGSILFAQKKLPTALTYFSKAEEIYSGKRKCAKKREKLIKIIEMIRKSCKDDKIKTSEDRLKERPRFA